MTLRIDDRPTLHLIPAYPVFPDDCVGEEWPAKEGVRVFDRQIGGGIGMGMPRTGKVIHIGNEFTNVWAEPFFWVLGYILEFDDRTIGEDYTTPLRTRLKFGFQFGV